MEINPPQTFPSLGRLCRNVGIKMFVILNPSLTVTLSEARSLSFPLRVNSVKNLMISTESIIEILRLSPQNDITTQSLGGRG
ncbi:MAG: hypothetical protein A2V86_13565 [Deltaproteobacteria bacterium RBG_16_49_23]|nr:MAG: hypothetical protein A2V86_13565 [Deltaproteobacteria bacterium RBG_16_49_23]